MPSCVCFVIGRGTGGSGKSERAPAISGSLGS
jgi:hypothetical protein